MWRRYNRSNPCPLCGSRGQKFKRGCQYADCDRRQGSRYVICMNTAAGAFRTEYNERFGCSTYHHLVDRSGLPAVREVEEAPLAPAANLTAAYGALLTGRLAPLHYAYLQSRGFTEADLVRLRYTTLSETIEERDAAARSLAAAGVELGGVPGFWPDRDGGWHLAGPGGILLPLRAAAGEIVGCKINVNRVIALYMRYNAAGLSLPAADRDKLRGKYLWLSSTPEFRAVGGDPRWVRRGGAQAVPRCHFPFAEAPADDFLDLYRPRPSRFLVVEGVLKADLVACRWRGDERVVGLPGVGACHGELARHLGFASAVDVALDPDWQRPDHYEDLAEEDRQRVDRRMIAVGDALASLLTRVAATLDLSRVRVFSWPLAVAKGLDDLLLAGRTDAILATPAAEWLRNHRKEAA